MHDNVYNANKNTKLYTVDDAQNRCQHSSSKSINKLEHYYYLERRSLTHRMWAIARASNAKPEKSVFSFEIGDTFPSTPRSNTRSAAAGTPAASTMAATASV